MKMNANGVSEKTLMQLGWFFEKAVQEAYAEGKEDERSKWIPSLDKPVEVFERYAVGDKVRFIGTVGEFNKDVTIGKVYEINEACRTYALFIDDSEIPHNRSIINVDYAHLFEKVVESETKSPNQQRYETIQQAREFVEEYEGDIGDARYVGNNTAQMHMYETDFIVMDRKVTAVVYRLNQDGRIGVSSHVGRSFCSVGDVFNADIGKAIALARALEIEIPEEFLKAVQPSEVVVGMKLAIVDFFTNTRNGEIQLVDYVACDKPYFSNGQTSTLYDIIDDSNAEYGEPS